MREAAVIGSPVAHSLSPAIFRYLSARLNPMFYSARNLDSNQLADFFAAVRAQPTWVGFNVTIPHKERVGADLDEVSAEAKAIGAVNAVTRSGQILTGHNTDVSGILATFRQSQFVTQSSTALILGAGGAARAVAFALGHEHAAQVALINRNETRAHALASEFSNLFPQTQFFAFKNFESFSEAQQKQMASPLNLIVNATSLGMTQSQAAPPPNLPSDADAFFAGLKDLRFEPRALAFDLIYTPLETPFLKAAAAKKLTTVGGLNMLVQQALASWQLWFPKSSPTLTQNLEIAHGLVDHLAQLLELRARPKRPIEGPIFLTGAMGAGKSAVAAGLAERIGWRHIDTDRLVEEHAGLSVSEIFSSHGEDYFRTLEHEAIKTAANLKRSIVSLGGGALLRTDSQALVKQSGLLVYLKARPATLVARIDHDHARGAPRRPLLANLASADARVQKVEALIKDRQATYETASLTIATDTLSTIETIEQIEYKLFDIPLSQRMIQ